MRKLTIEFPPKTTFQTLKKHRNHKKIERENNWLFVALRPTWNGAVDADKIMQHVSVLGCVTAVTLWFRFPFILSHPYNRDGFVYFQFGIDISAWITYFKKVKSIELEQKQQIVKLSIIFKYEILYKLLFNQCNDNICTFIKKSWNEKKGL